MVGAADKIKQYLGGWNDTISSLSAHIIMSEMEKFLRATYRHLYWTKSLGRDESLFCFDD